MRMRPHILALCAYSCFYIEAELYLSDSNYYKKADNADYCSISKSTYTPTNYAKNTSCEIESECARG